ncbi:endocytosis defective- protein [Dinochytrium kinnereticum]|nr:endocytosis defective- protein [Dinochytrium kinnereticum]
MDFDWYISPSERFAKENEFSKLCKKGEDAIIVSQLEPLFQVSRISQEDFLQIWNLISLGSPSINEEQFVYFKHVLDSRRKGRPLPIGVPLNIKEAFLKEKVENRVYTRTVLGTRDPGASSGKDASLLQVELDAVEEKLKAAKSEQGNLDDQIKDLQQVRDELQGLVQFKRAHLSALKDDVQMLKGGDDGTVVGGGGGHPNSFENLLDALRQERRALENRKNELQQHTA